MFESTKWHTSFLDIFIRLRRYTVICKQLLISRDGNRFRWEVLGLDGACTDLFENLSVNSWERDLSNANTFNPPNFSLVNTFKEQEVNHLIHKMLNLFLKFLYIFDKKKGRIYIRIRLHILTNRITDPDTGGELMSDPHFSGINRSKSIRNRAAGY
jgi:hypothetical protein